MKYVIGNNIASYFTAYVLNLTLIKHKTLEQLDGNHGPDIIPEKLLKFCKNIFKDCSIKEYERFYDDRGKFTSKRPKNFYKLYCLYTRGKTNVESSYINNLEKYQKYVSINNLSPEESFYLLIKKIKESVNKNCIDKPIEHINIQGTITFKNEEVNFDKLLSTINLIDLAELDGSGKIRKSIIENYGLNGFNLPYNDKFIYICNLNSKEDKTLSGIYKQVLATGRPYFRKTYIGNKIYYDCMRNIYDKSIEENKIIEYAETTEISDNLCINKVMGIDLIGKFSQWKNTLDIGTIYNDCLELLEYYGLDEKNHKKIF